MTPQKEKALKVLRRKLAEVRTAADELANEGYAPEARQKMRLARVIEAQIALLTES
jgi:hypothetical protein